VQGDQWKKTTLQMALLFPGVLFAIFFALNMLVWGQKSSGAVPFGTLFALFFLWFGISTPLVFIGSYFGYKKPAPEDLCAPTRSHARSQTRHVLPPQHRFISLAPFMLLIRDYSVSKIPLGECCYETRELEGDV